MGSQPDEIGLELLAQMKDQAEVLGVFDEGQDIALDLHEGLFDPSTQQRALAFLQSPRYASAVEAMRRIATGPVALPNGDES